MILTISLISIIIAVNESYAQSTPDDAFISNVIIIPDTTRTAETSQTTNEPIITMITLTSKGETGKNVDLPTAQANKRNQSPFEQVPSGEYNIGIVIPEGYTLIDAKCAYQKPDGKWVSMGELGKENNVIGIDLASQTAHKCTWKLEQQNTLTEEIPIAVAEVQKLLEIKGDPTSENAFYEVVVTGQIIPGPNAEPSDIILDDNTLNGIVWIKGMDDFYFTGDIVSITADYHIFSFVNGVQVPNDSPP